MEGEGKVAGDVVAFGGGGGGKAGEEEEGVDCFGLGWWVGLSWVGFVGGEGRGEG